MCVLEGPAGPGCAGRVHREVAAQPPLLPRRARRRLARGACARPGGDDGTQSYGADAPLRLPAAARVRAEGFLTMPGLLWLASSPKSGNTWMRSEDSRVGKEVTQKFRSWWEPCHIKKKTK